MSSENIFTNSYNQINLPPLPGSNHGRKGCFLKITSINELSDFIKHFNNKLGKSFDPTAKSEEIIQNLRHNLNNCFPNSNLLNIDFIKEEKNTNFYKKIYAFLLDENLNLISSLSVHFFRQEGQQWYSKIHDVCAAPNQTGTKILMLQILDEIKPISEIIWLNVLPYNHKAYNLYLDIGFEFVFNNKTDLLDMIYVQKDIISSRGNDVLMTQRQNIINDMVNYKIYRNYINIIGDKLVPAVRTQYYPPQEEKQTEEEEKNIIKNFMQHVYDFITPNYMEVDTGYDLKYNIPQPVLVFTNKHGKAHYLFINSLVNNIENFNEELKDRFEGTLRYILNAQNINNEDSKILFRTLFPIKTTVTITNEVLVNPLNPIRTYNHTEHILNLNFFVIIDKNEITPYNYPEITGGDIYNMNIDSLERINEIDLYVKYALNNAHEQTHKICVRIPKNIDIDLRRLYYTYNLLPSYSACPSKPNTFVYNIKRFNNINNRFWELDSFDFNNLYVYPNQPLDLQPITKDILSTISGCSNLNDTLENYFVGYLNYLKPSTGNPYKFYFAPEGPYQGTGIILSFLGYLILQCNKNFIDQMISNYHLTNVLEDANNINRWVQITPFSTLNHYNSDRIKPDLIHNINIFCHSRIVDYMSSLSHGSMLPNIRTLERGQKLIMYTRPNNLFHMINLNYNFMTLIFDNNNIQRLFDCIELLNNDNIRIQTYFGEYREIIKALLANISSTESDIYLYTQYYHEHSLLYNQEVINWVNYPISGPHQHYEGRYVYINNRQIRLIGIINPDKINTNFSLEGLYVNFNNDNNTTSNRVHAFEFRTLTVTLTEDVSIYNPFVIERVIIGTLPYYFRYPNPLGFYNNILADSYFNDCNRHLILNYLVTNDAVLTNFPRDYSNNFEINNQTCANLSQNLLNTFRTTTVGFGNYFNSDAQLKRLSDIIIFRKLLEGKDSIHQKPSSIETNNGITFVDFTQRDIPNNAYIKQHISNNSTVNLSTLLDKKLKYNSFICCRGVEGGAIFNPVQLQGEIRVSAIINRRRAELGSL